MRATTDSYRPSGSDFDKLLVESVDESMDTVLGPTASRVLFEVIESTYSVAKYRIPGGLDEFTLAMERSFGTAPSKTIERIIARGLYSKLGLAFAGKTDLRLPDYVREAKAKASELIDPVERS